MAQHLNPLEKEFFVQRYLKNPKIKLKEFCVNNNISETAFRKWLRQYKTEGIEGLARHDTEIRDILPKGIDKTEESHKREILKLRIENERLKKKLHGGEQRGWNEGIHSFKAQEFEIVELLSRDYGVKVLCEVMGISRS